VEGTESDLTGSLDFMSLGDKVRVETPPGVHRL
jgi:hypothetical protein